MKNILLVSWMVMAGCVEGAALDESSAERAALAAPEEPPEQEVQYESEQGRFVIGRTADGYYNPATDRHFHVRRRPVDLGHSSFLVGVTASAQGAHLVAKSDPPLDESHSTDDDWFDGMVLEGVDGGRVRIESAVKDPSGRYTSYILKYRRPGALSFNEYYCGLDDLGQPIGASPTLGYYDQSRYHHYDATVLTLGCWNGTLAKCLGWGYVPGTVGPSGDPVQSPSDWDYHQACTRMASADYCSRGQPFTRELTPVVIRDFHPAAQPAPGAQPVLVHPHPFPGNPDWHYIEAAWRPGRRPPVCVSKSRWAGLPIQPCGPSGGGGDECLADPRLDPNAKTCEEYTFADLRAAGALIVNASKMMDTTLQAWERPASGGKPADVMTSMRGFYSPSSLITVANYQNPAFTFPAPHARTVYPWPDYVKFTGARSMVLRNLPGTLEEEDMIPLFLWERDADRFVGSEGVANTLGFTSNLGFEAHAFSSATQINAGLFQLYVCPGPKGFDLAGSSGPGCLPSGFAMPLP